MKLYVFFLLISVSLAFSQTSKYPIEVIDGTVPDNYNRAFNSQFVYQFKEDINKSSFMKLASNDSLRMSIYIVTLRFPDEWKNCFGENQMFVLSFVWTVKDETKSQTHSFLDNAVLFCDVEHIESMANSMTAITYQKVLSITQEVKK